MTSQVNSDNDKAKISYFGLDVSNDTKSTTDVTISQDKRVSVSYDRIKFLDNFKTTSRTLWVKEDKDKSDNLKLNFEGWGDRKPFKSDTVHFYPTKVEQIFKDISKLVKVRTKIDPNIDNVPAVHVQNL